MPRQTTVKGKSIAKPDGDGPIADYLKDLHFRVGHIQGGAVASYIPELAKENPHLCGVAIATVDGEIYTAGDCGHAFTIQSVSKPFVYGYALQEYGREIVMQHVGVEPTGEAFNSIVLDQEHNRPYNPMVNAGAIAMAEMIKGATPRVRVQTMLDLFSRFAGRTLDIDEAVFLSEQATGHRNRAIAYMMLNTGMVRQDPEDILDIYFRQCAVRVTCRDLAIMSATLANDGVNPVTGARALAQECVYDVLTVMSTCGMYNYAGQWTYEIGVPAKSGVSGSIVAVIPGQAGIAVFSPPIDENGNSVRGVAACREIAEEFGLHAFKTHPNARAVIRRELHGGVIRSKRAWTAEERRVLDEKGGEICVIEVQDALFFASAERLLRRVSQVAETAKHIILDMRRVYSADEASHALIARLHDSSAARGRTLAVAHLSGEGPLARLHACLVEKTGGAPHILFADRDSALEWCEGLLLKSAPRTDTSRYALSSLEIFRGLTGDEIRLIEDLAQPLVYEAGATIVREGDEAHIFFVVTRGSASVRLSVDGERERKVRVASIGPGVSFGEMALLDGGRRSADVVADERVVCYGFSVDELRKLGEAYPPIMIKMFANMTRDLSERLRRANNEIRALEN